MSLLESRRINEFVGKWKDQWVCWKVEGLLSLFESRMINEFVGK